MRVKLLFILYFSIVALSGCTDSAKVDPCKDEFAPPNIFYEFLNQDDTQQPDSLFTKIICLDEQVAYSSDYALSGGSLPLDLSDDETTYVFYHTNTIDTLVLKTTHDLVLGKVACGFKTQLTSVKVSYSTFARQTLELPNWSSNFGIFGKIKIYP